MSLRNKLCPKCKNNIIKNYQAKSCWGCHKKTRSGNGNGNWRGSSICIKCNGMRSRNNKTKLCGKCYRKEYHKGLPKCIECGNDLSTYSASNIGTGYCQKCYIGEKTKRWNFDLTDEERFNGRTINPDYYQWRINVFEKDDYSCQKCGDNKGGNLVAHHIEGYLENKNLRIDINNGITFCSDCHRDYHDRYGYKNATRINLEKFLLN